MVIASAVSLGFASMVTVVPLYARFGGAASGLALSLASGILDILAVVRWLRPGRLSARTVAGLDACLLLTSSALRLWTGAWEWGLGILLPLAYAARVAVGLDMAFEGWWRARSTPTAEGSGTGLDAPKRKQG